VIVLDLVQFGQIVWLGLVDGVSYALFASGLVLIFGIMGIFNFVHGELYMIGAMLVFTLQHYFGLNLLASVPLSILTVAILGVIINRLAVQPLFRFSPFPVLIATLALSLILLNGAGAIWTVRGRLIEHPFAGVISAGGLHFSIVGIALIISGGIVIAALYLFLTKVKIGKQIRATAQNLTGASVVGINTLTIYDITWMTAAALAAVGGIWGGILHSATPVMGQHALILGFVIAVVAGLGNLAGAAVIGVAIGILESLFTFYFEPLYTKPFIYSILVIVLLLKPQGLFAKRER